jgi:hypothetical protein
MIATLQHQVNQICRHFNIKKGHLELFLKVKPHFLSVIELLLDSSSQLSYVGETPIKFYFKLGLNKKSGGEISRLTH